MNMEVTSASTSKTGRVMEAIVAGHKTLREISIETALTYRTVNALVDGLERQFRIEANSYELPRRTQEFRAIPERVRQTRRMQYNAVHKSEAQGEKPGRRPHPRTITVLSAVPEGIHTLFGIRPAFVPTFNGPTHVYREGRVLTTDRQRPR